MVSLRCLPHHTHAQIQYANFVKNNSKKKKPKKHLVLEQNYIFRAEIEILKTNKEDIFRFLKK